MYPSCMPSSQGSLSSSIQAMSCISSPKEVGESSVSSGCSCVSVVGLISGISFTTASILSAEVCWALISVSFGSSSLSNFGGVDDVFYFYPFNSSV